jgi:hypothetical protein
MRWAMWLLVGMKQPPQLRGQRRCRWERLSESLRTMQTEERETENRGRKALHEVLKEMAERIQSKEGAHAVTEFLLAEQGRDVQLGRPGKWLRSVLLHVSGSGPEKRIQQTAALG